jgi:hypothetical protein
LVPAGRLVVQLGKCRVAMIRDRRAVATRGSARGEKRFATEPQSKELLARSMAVRRPWPAGAAAPLVENS